MTARTLLACCLILSSAALAQGRILIVDKSGGGQFPDLPDAIAAANPGDVLRVRPGLYSAFTLDKGISIVGGPSVRIGSPFTSPIVVSGVPETQTVVLSGLTIALISLRIEHCAGPVLIDNVTVAWAKGLQVQSCGQVQISACTLEGGATENTGSPALDVSTSVVAVADSTLTGANAWGAPGRGTVSSPGLRTSASSVSLSRCRVTGGFGGQGWAPSSPGVSSVSSTIWLYGTGAEAITAQGPDPVPGISLNGGALFMDQVVRVISFGAAQPVEGTGTVTRTWLPSLQVKSAPPGGVLTTGLFSPAGDLVLHLVSTPTAPLSATTGLLWLDLNRHLVLGVGVQGAARNLVTQVPLPDDQSLSFGSWILQSISGTPAGGFKLSNGVGATLH